MYIIIFRHNQVNLVMELGTKGQTLNCFPIQYAFELPETSSCQTTRTRINDNSCNSPFEGLPAPHKLAEIIYIHNLESLLLFLHRRRGVPFINMHAFSGSFPLLLGYTTMFCVVLCCAMACLVLRYNGGSGGASVEAGADAGAVEGEDVTIENAHNLKISKHSVRHNGINGIILNIHSPHLLPYTCVCGGSFFLRPLLSLPHNSPI